MNEILLNQTNLYTRSTIFKYIDMYAPPPLKFAHLEHL